jgi:hypothetical protein
VVRANHESHSPASDRGPAEVSLGGMPWSATRGPDPISPHPARERRVTAPRKRMWEDLRSCRARALAARRGPGAQLARRRPWSVAYQCRRPRGRASRPGAACHGTDCTPMRTASARIDLISSEWHSAARHIHHLHRKNREVVCRPLRAPCRRPRERGSQDDGIDILRQQRRPARQKVVRALPEPTCCLKAGPEVRRKHAAR